jgi:SAM-dependent methyltransferase
MNDANEVDAIVGRYARRPATDRYSLLRPDVWMRAQESERAMLALFGRHGLQDPEARRCVEVGCGSGSNLLELLRMGFRPEHLAGIELLPGRHAEACARLPASIDVYLGDASRFEFGPTQDLVLAFTVFSSILDDAFQQRLAGAMWRWLKPGGAVLWYDFMVNNPRNRDVRGVPLRRVRALFPDASVDAMRVTLAPPLARAACRVHPGLYTVLGAAPFLRTHLLAWLAKR